MKRWFLVISGIFLIMGGFGLYAWRLKPALKTYQNSKHQVSFSYPAEAQLDTAHKDGRVVKVSNASGQVEYSLVVDYETDLKTVATAAHKPLIDALIANAAKSLPKTYPRFEQTDSKKYQVDGHDAAEIQFTYMNMDEPITARLVMVTVSDNKAVYIRAQTKSGAFPQVNKRQFEPIITSLNL